MNTNNQELYKRNLVSTITECLKEHTVELSGNEGIIPRYLIEVKLKSSLFQDFMDTYNKGVDKFKQELASKVLRKKPTEQTYGVLIDTELKCDFAFNRKFADIKRKENKIAFKNVEDVLLEATNKPNSSGNNYIPSSYPSGGGSGIFPSENDMVIRYALTGKLDKSKGESNNGIINYDRASLLKNVKNNYKKNSVKLQLEDGKIHNMFLINTSYQTSLANDFINTYQNDLDEFKTQLAIKQFGNSKTYNSYGLLFSEDLQIAFAFNNRFAEYDKNTQSIVYYPAEEVLLGKTDKTDLSKKIIDTIKDTYRRIEIPDFPTRRGYSGRNRGGGGMTLRYALQGKPEDN